MAKEKKEDSSKRLIDGAIEEGMDAILKHHPKFRGAVEYIEKHIDKKRLAHGISEIQRYIAEKGENWNEEQRAEFMYKNLANYVASGGAFDDSAKEVILKGSLEEKANETKPGWFGLRKRQLQREVEGEKCLDKVTDAFGDVYSLMKSGDYAQRMPELAQAVGTIYDMGFLDSTVDVLQEKGLLNRGQYSAIKRAIKERREEAIEESGEHIKKYIEPRKVAASIIGLSGLSVIIMSRASITGNVVGVSSNNIVSGLFGITLLIISIIIFLKK